MALTKEKLERFARGVAGLSPLEIKILTDEAIKIIEHTPLPTDEESCERRASIMYVQLKERGHHIEL